MKKSPTKIFIIYARKDVEFKNDLVRAISPLVEQAWVEVWHDGLIQPGQVWDDEIRRHLAAADLIFPLLSPDFFTSRYIREVELPEAMRRLAAKKSIVIPIVVRACDWTSDERLARLQVLPPNGHPVGSLANRDEAWQQVVSGIRQLVEPKKAPAPPPPKRKPARLWQYAVPIFLLLILVVGGMEWQRIERKKAVETTDFQQVMTQYSLSAMSHFLEKYPHSSRAVQVQARRVAFQDSLQYYVGAARALYNGDERVEAQKAYQKAAAIDPNDPEVQSLSTLFSQ